jgi:tetratricopeptide (TPR) repeat protein
MKAAVIMLFLLPLHLLAQIHIDIKKYNADSLEQLIPHRQGAELADIYNKLASTYSFDNPPLCEQYANQAITLSKELVYLRGIADAERLLGQMYWYEGDYPETVIHYYNALEDYEKINDNYSLAKLYYDFAKLYFYINDYAKAEEYGQRAIDYYQLKKADGTATGSFEDIARLRSALGLLYRRTNRTAEARDIYRWYNKIDVEQGFGINDRMVHTLVFAECFYENGEFDSALF